MEVSVTATNGQRNRISKIKNQLTTKRDKIIIFEVQKFDRTMHKHLSIELPRTPKL